MKAAILAGGQGTRMNGLHPGLPKPMIPIAGKPLLQHQVEALAGQGISDITLILGHKASVIHDFFGDGRAFGANISYIVEENPLGTGGALHLLAKEDTLVLFGDLYFDVDFSRLIRFHQERRALITLFAHPNSHPEDSDLVVTGDHGKVLELKSKKDANRGELRNLANAGIYLFSREALLQAGAGRRDLEQDCIRPLMPFGRVYAYRSTEYVRDMGTPERLAAVEKDAAHGAIRARNLKHRQRAVFIDRDGTINAGNGFIRSPEQLRLMPGAGAAIGHLNASPFLTVCLTNQPVIARGEVTFEELDAIHAHMDVLLAREGAYLDDLFFCPHHPDKGFLGERPSYKTDCDCRKPRPGLLMKAADRYHIDLSRSYMIGDSTTDIAAGQAAGCTTIGLGTGAALGDGKCAVRADHICGDLFEAVAWIMERA